MGRWERTEGNGGEAACPCWRAGRLELFACFVDGAESPVEAVRMGCDASLENAAYHVRVLHRAGLLEQVGERRNRGAVEHLYTATDRGVELFDAVTGRGVR